MTIPSHEPTPEFARFLEWQVTTAVRRQTRFAEPARPAYLKHLGIAALVVVSILIGAGGVTAASRIQTNEQTKFLLAQQAAEMRIAQLQADAAKAALDQVKRLSDVGASTAEDFAAAEHVLARATTELKRASLNAEEIRASGKPVQDDLAAPLVGRRDFVSERLQLDQQLSAVAVRASADKLKTVKKRFDVGLSGEVEVAEAQAVLTRAMAEEQETSSLADLRRQFIAGSLKAADVRNRRHVIAMTSQLTVAESELDLATKRYALMQKRAAVGTATEVELLKARIEMLSKQNDVAQLKARIREAQ
jgi:outer membrane protein TolC